MDITIARLEAWMRDYHEVDHDIGSSGVRDLTVAGAAETVDWAAER
jgi:hypothetical protein